MEKDLFKYINNHNISHSSSNHATGQQIAAKLCLEAPIDSTGQSIDTLSSEHSPLTHTQLTSEKKQTALNKYNTAYLKRCY